MSETMVDKAIAVGHKKVYGENSLTLLEVVGFIIGAYLILFPVGKLGEKNSRYLGLLIIFVTEALA